MALQSGRPLNALTYHVLVAYELREKAPELAEPGTRAVHNTVSADEAMKLALVAAASLRAVRLNPDGRVFIVTSRGTDLSLSSWGQGTPAEGWRA